MRLRKQHIPWMMAAGRALLGPVVMAGERCGWNGFVLAGLIVTALLSDIYDGVLARRWKCDTAAARLFDSMADTFFYACVVATVWQGQPVLWANWRGPIGALLGLEAARIAFDMLKFGKPASYHSYLAKTWGLVLAAAVVTVFATQHSTPLLTLAIALGVACNLESFAMSLMLPRWRNDVKTLAVAWRMRREMLGEAAASSTRLPKAVAAVLMLCVVLPAVATEPVDARYESGTVAGLTRNVRGKLDLSNPLVLVFTPNGGSAVEIPYDRMREFQESNPVKHHLGFFPAMFAGMLMPRRRLHMFSITYRDANNASQVMLLEIPKTEVTLVSDVLRQRAAGCQARGTHCGRR